MFTVNVRRSLWHYRVVLADVEERSVLRSRRMSWTQARALADSIVAQVKDDPSEIFQTGS